MNKGHVKFREVINLEKLRSDMDVGATHALVRTEAMEVIRMALPEGKQIKEHSVEGEITVQCLKGKVQFRVGDETKYLSTEDWIFLEGGVPHAVHANEDAVLLLTILFTDQGEGDSSKG
jgi:quercetin dioxygenase-like cupin family protein